MFVDCPAHILIVWSRVCTWVSVLSLFMTNQWNVTVVWFGFCLLTMVTSKHHVKLVTLKNGNKNRIGKRHHFFPAKHSQLTPNLVCTFWNCDFAHFWKERQQNIFDKVTPHTYHIMLHNFVRYQINTNNKKNNNNNKCNKNNKNNKKFQCTKIAKNRPKKIQKKFKKKKIKNNPSSGWRRFCFLKMQCPFS